MCTHVPVGNLLATSTSDTAPTHTILSRDLVATLPGGRALDSFSAAFQPNVCVGKLAV